MEDEEEKSGSMKKNQNNRDYLVLGEPSIHACLTITPSFFYLLLSILGDGGYQLVSQLVGRLGVIPPTYSIGLLHP